MAIINNIKINSNFQHGCNYAEQHGKATEVHRSLMSVRRSIMHAVILPMYSQMKTTKKGVTRSFIPWTYPLAGWRMAHMNSILSKIWKKSEQLVEQKANTAETS